MVTANRDSNMARARIDHQPAARVKTRGRWSKAAPAAALAALVIVAVRADGDPQNTGMADPAALMSAFDRSVGGGDAGNGLVLSLSNLRGVSSEALNAGGTGQDRSRRPAQ